MRKYAAGIGEIVFGEGEDILTAHALGSCVGLVLFDPEKKISGMAHVALPSMIKSVRNAEEHAKRWPGRYADMAVKNLLEGLKQRGATNIYAKLAGGSIIFDIKVDPNQDHLGKQTYAKITEELSGRNITVIAQDVDGHWIRSLEFYNITGVLSVQKSVFMQQKSAELNL
ncbi:MAG: chemotaxis protein CheD [Candidatus Heimdallarchaeota archaeon]|nr:chemotaxis protein CheD [Candidatus Heimdallarchaeota archaeon]